MDLYFARNDLLQTATTQRGTLVVLPLSTGKKQQKARHSSCSVGHVGAFCRYRARCCFFHIVDALESRHSDRPLVYHKPWAQVGVGDSDGILQVFAAKQSGETIPTFKTAPTGSQACTRSLVSSRAFQLRML